MLSFNGSIYDVTEGANNYGVDGPYHVFCGHEITKCLALFSTEASDLDDLTFSARDTEEAESLTNWANRLAEKYPRVGRLIGAKAPTTPLPTKATPSSPQPEEEKKTPLLKATDEQRKKAEETGLCPMTGKPGTCPLTGLIGKPADEEKKKKKRSILVEDKPGEMTSWISCRAFALCIGIPRMSRFSWLSRASHGQADLS